MQFNWLNVVLKLKGTELYSMRKEDKQKTLDKLKEVASRSKGVDKDALLYRIKELETEDEVAQQAMFNAKVPYKRLTDKIFKEESIKSGLENILANCTEKEQERELKSKIDMLENKLFFLNQELRGAEKTNIELEYQSTTGIVKFDISEISVTPAFDCKSIQFIVDDMVKETIDTKFQGEINIRLQRSKEFEILLHGKKESILSIMFFPCQYFLDQDGSIKQRFQFNHAHFIATVEIVREAKLLRKNAQIIQVIRYGHVLENFNIMSPFYCCVCNCLISFFSQAYRCKLCRFTCHKRCCEFILFQCPCAKIEKFFYRKGYNIPHRLDKKYAIGLTWCAHCGVRIDVGSENFKCKRCGISVHGECKPLIFAACGIEQEFRNKMSTFNPPPPESAVVRSRIKIEEFKLIKVIGRGSFGKVMLAKHEKDNKTVALKILKKESLVNGNEVSYIELERKVLAFSTRENHPFLMKMDYCFQDHFHIYFGTEFLPGGDLFHHAAKSNFSHEQIKLYACEILLGIGHLHENNIIYRDLKLDNLLLDANGHVKIADFGLCKDNFGPTEKTYTYCGTPDTIAPEVINEEGYTKDADWWSFGIVLYEMFETEPPFTGATNAELSAQILSANIEFTERTPSEAKDLIIKLLNRNPEERIGFGREDYKAIQKHKYFEFVDWVNIKNLVYEPVYKPDLSFIANFDKEFVDAAISLTPCDSQTKYDHYFANFR